jgi:hypothetical protein
MPQRFGDASGGVFRAPWLHPRADALLQVADDTLGHFGVNVFAAYAIGVRNLCVGHFPVSFKWAL